MKIKLVLICCFISVFLNAQKKKIGYLNTKTGDTINLYSTSDSTSFKKYDQILSGYVSLSKEYVFYYNELGERQEFSQKKVDRLEYGDRAYINLPIGKFGMSRLHEVVAENDKYILTNYYSNAYWLYVFDKETLKFKVSKEWNSFKRKKDLKLIEKKIMPYFKDCKDLVEQLRNNVEIGDYDTQKKEFRSVGGTRTIRRLLFGDIYNFKCE